MAQELVIGIDVGGQTTKCGVVDARGDVLSQTVVRSDSHTDVKPYIDELAVALKKLIADADAEGSVRGIGVGAPNAKDGLRFYRGILKYWRSLLKPGGYLLFEVGEGQAEAVKELVLSAGFASASTRKDTLGVERVVVGKMYDEDGELYSGF